MSARIGEALRRAVGRFRALAPPLALALVVPGGFVLALLLWLHARKEDKPRRDARLRVGRCRGTARAIACDRAVVAATREVDVSESATE